MPKIDLTGQRFGKLVVIKDSGKRGSNGGVIWECQCDCGNITYVEKGNLTRKKNPTNSCGKCYKGEDLTGQKFNLLTVLGPTDQRTNGKMVWKCQCDCGEITYVHTANLKNGAVKSCGCLMSGGKRKDIFTPLDIKGKKFGKLIPLEYLGERKWKCQCDCGNSVEVFTHNLTSGNTTSCGCSNNYKGEQKIQSILEKNKIPFVTQKTFDFCIYPNTNRKARFDFFVDNKYLIEYDGIQHFELLSSFYNQNPQTVLTTNQQHDNFKNKWCKENNIPLIRIPYTHLEDICLEDLLPKTSQFLI